VTGDARDTHACRDDLRVSAAQLISALRGLCGRSDEGRRSFITAPAFCAASSVCSRHTSSRSSFASRRAVVDCRAGLWPWRGPEPAKRPHASRTGGACCVFLAFQGLRNTPPPPRTEGPLPSGSPRPRPGPGPRPVPRGRAGSREPSSRSAPGRGAPSSAATPGNRAVPQPPLTMTLPPEPIDPRSGTLRASQEFRHNLYSRRKCERKRAILR
jgi:hypothetical protein